MTEDQEAHLRWLKLRFAELADAKYRKGVQEHGGNLWEKGIEYFINAAIDEAIDQVTYLLTLKEALLAEKRKDLVWRHRLYDRGEHQ